ncbi:MAG TPA: DinB family protein [Planctomycetota bacterium]|nr:DinB family protein [Planctomycetota bacterium]
MDFDLDRALVLLVRTPAILRAWLGDLDPVWLHANTGAETFSPYDVLGHLIEGERTDWMPRLQRILEHGESLAFDPFDRFAMRQWSRGRAVQDLLDEFTALRQRNLDVLRDLALQRADYSPRGRHPGLGTVTLGQLLATWVVHDQNHLAQIARTLAFQYLDAVGPWREYLSILPRA